MCEDRFLKLGSKLYFTMNKTLRFELLLSCTTMSNSFHYTHYTKPISKTKLL